MRATMKRLFLLVAAAAGLCAAPASAEDSLGIDMSLAGAVPVKALKPGAAAYEGGLSHAFGARASTRLRGNLEIEIGVGWVEANARRTHYPLPGGWDRVTAGHMRLLTIPVSIRRKLRERLSLDYGVSLDIATSTNEDVAARSGIGLGLGLRTERDLARHCRVFANPYVAAHALLGLENTHEGASVWEAGLRIGIRYRSRNSESRP
jgi:hypothetical protein